MIVLPYSAATHHCISTKEIAQMRNGATLTNVARGGVVDDVALISALRSQQIAAAGLDVYENEPHFHAEFLNLRNVVLTPHIASASLATRRAMQQCAVNNLMAFFEGGKIINPVSG